MDCLLVWEEEHHKEGTLYSWEQTDQVTANFSPDMTPLTLAGKTTGNDRYSGDGYSGIDRFSGTKNPDDAILFTVCGITATVEQNF